MTATVATYLICILLFIFGVGLLQRCKSILTPKTLRPQPAGKVFSGKPLDDDDNKGANKLWGRTRQGKATLPPSADRPGGINGRTNNGTKPPNGGGRGCPNGGGGGPPGRDSSNGNGGGPPGGNGPGEVQTWYQMILEGRARNVR